jgi:hypothetical protein
MRGCSYRLMRNIVMKLPFGDELATLEPESQVHRQRRPFFFADSMQATRFPEIGMQQTLGRHKHHEQYIYGRELQVSPSPAEPSSRSSRRDAAGKGLPAPAHAGDGAAKNSRYAFRIPMPMTTCSVEQH